MLWVQTNNGRIVAATDPLAAKEGVRSHCREGDKAWTPGPPPGMGGLAAAKGKARRDEADSGLNLK